MRTETGVRENAGELLEASYRRLEQVYNELEKEGRDLRRTRAVPPARLDNRIPPNTVGGGSEHRLWTSVLKETFANGLKELSRGISEAKRIQFEHFNPVEVRISDRTATTSRFGSDTDIQLDRVRSSLAREQRMIEMRLEDAKVARENLERELAIRNPDRAIAELVKKVIRETSRLSEVVQQDQKSKQGRFEQVAQVVESLKAQLPAVSSVFVGQNGTEATRITSQAIPPRSSSHQPNRLHDASSGLQRSSPIVEMRAHTVTAVPGEQLPQDSLLSQQFQTVTSLVEKYQEVCPPTTWEGRQLQKKLQAEIECLIQSPRLGAGKDSPWHSTLERHHKKMNRTTNGEQVQQSGESLRAVPSNQAEDRETKQPGIETVNLAGGKGQQQTGAQVSRRNESKESGSNSRTHSQKKMVPSSNKRQSNSSSRIQVGQNRDVLYPQDEEQLYPKVIVLSPDEQKHVQQTHSNQQTLLAELELLRAQTAKLGKKCEDRKVSLKKLYLIVQEKDKQLRLACDALERVKTGMEAFGFVVEDRQEEVLSKLVFLEQRANTLAQCVAAIPSMKHNGPVKHPGDGSLEYSFTRRYDNTALGKSAAMSREDREGSFMVIENQQKGYTLNKSAGESMDGSFKPGYLTSPHQTNQKLMLGDIPSAFNKQAQTSQQDRSAVMQSAPLNGVGNHSDFEDLLDHSSKAIWDKAQSRYDEEGFQLLNKVLREWSRLIEGFDDVWRLEKIKDKLHIGLDSLLEQSKDFQIEIDTFSSAIDVILRDSSFLATKSVLQLKEKSRSLIQKLTSQHKEEKGNLMRKISNLEEEVHRLAVSHTQLAETKKQKNLQSQTFTLLELLGTVSKNERAKLVLLPPITLQTSIKATISPRTLVMMVPYQHLPPVSLPARKLQLVSCNLEPLNRVPLRRNLTFETTKHFNINPKLDQGSKPVRSGDGVSIRLGIYQQTPISLDGSSSKLSISNIVARNFAAKSTSNRSKVILEPSKLPSASIPGSGPLPRHLQTSTWTSLSVNSAANPKPRLSQHTMPSTSVSPRPPSRAPSRHIQSLSVLSLSGRPSVAVVCAECPLLRQLHREERLHTDKLKTLLDTQTDELNELKQTFQEHKIEEELLLGEVDEVRAERDLLQQELDRHKTVGDALRREVEVLSKDLPGLKKSKHEDALKLVGLQQELEKSQLQLQEALRNSLATIEAERQRAVMERCELEGSVKKEWETMIKKLREKDLEIEAEKKLSLGLKGSLEELKVEIAQIMKANTDFQGLIADKDQEIKSLNKKFDVKSQSQTTKIEELTQQVTQKEKECKQYETACSQLETNLRQKDQGFNELLSRLQALEDELNSVRQLSAEEMTEAQNRELTLKKSCQELEELLEGQASEYDKEFTRLKGEYTHAIKMLEDSNRDIQVKDMEILRLKELQADLQATVQQRMDQIKILDAELAKGVKDKQGVLKTKETFIEKLQKELAAKDDEIERAKQLLGVAERRVNEWKMELDAKDTVINTLKLNMQAMGDEVVEKREIAAVLTEENRVFKKNLRETEEGLKNTESELQRQYDLLEDKNRYLEHLAEQNEQSKQRIEALEAEGKASKSKHKQLQLEKDKVNSDLEESRKENQETVKLLTKAKEESTTLTKAHHETQTKLEISQSQIAGLSNRIKELTEEKISTLRAKEELERTSRMELDEGMSVLQGALQQEREERAKDSTKWSAERETLKADVLKERRAKEWSDSQVQKLTQNTEEVKQEKNRLLEETKEMLKVLEDKEEEVNRHKQDLLALGSENVSLKQQLNHFQEQQLEHKEAHTEALFRISELESENSQLKLILAESETLRDQLELLRDQIKTLSTDIIEKEQKLQVCRSALRESELKIERLTEECVSVKEKWNFAEEMIETAHHERQVSEGLMSEAQVARNQERMAKEQLASELDNLKQLLAHEQRLKANLEVALRDTKEQLARVQKKLEDLQEAMKSNATSATMASKVTISESDAELKAYSAHLKWKILLLKVSCSKSKKMEVLFRLCSRKILKKANTASKFKEMYEKSQKDVVRLTEKIIMAENEKDAVESQLSEKESQLEHAMIQISRPNNTLRSEPDERIQVSNPMNMVNLTETSKIGFKPSQMMLRDITLVHQDMLRLSAPNHENLNERGWDNYVPLLKSALNKLISDSEDMKEKAENYKAIISQQTSEILKLQTAVDQNGREHNSFYLAGMDPGLSAVLNDVDNSLNKTKLNEYFRGGSGKVEIPSFDKGRPQDQEGDPIRLMQEYNVEIRRPNDESSANNDQAKSPEGAYSQRSNSPNQEERAGYLSPVVYDAPLPTSGTSDRLQSIQASPKIAETHAAEAKLKKYESENVALLAKIAALAEELSQKTEEIEDREELNKDINRRFGEAAREIEEWAESIAQLAEGKRTDAMEMREKIAWDKIALRLGTKAKLLREKISKVLAKKKGFF